MEKVFLKKSHSFTNKLSRAKRNFSATYDDIKSPDDIRCFDGTHYDKFIYVQLHTNADPPQSVNLKAGIFNPNSG